MKLSLSRSMSSRDRRALIWGGAICGAALVIAFGVKPYVRTLGETRDELDVQRELLARERAVLRNANLFPAALERSRSALTQQSTPLFAGVDELSATSDLSDYVSEAALGDRVLVQQVETRKAEALEEGLVALAVDIRAEGDFEGVLHFLNSLERGEKLVRVSTLKLDHIDRPVAAGGPDIEVLSVTATMTGYAAFPDTAAETSDTASPARSRTP
jgi:type II secretory pathway component PulM